MQRALPCASRVNATSPPPCANSELRAMLASDFDSVSGSAVTRAARESSLRWLCFAAGLSPLALRFVQSLCQCGPLHHLQGSHLSLHFSSGSGPGRFGSAGLARSSLLRTAKACRELGLDSSSRRTLRASVSLSTPRAALIVRAKLPTPAVRASFTSSKVEMLSLRRRTAFAIFSDRTVSGSRALAESERLRS
eukprot:2324981-Pleurochrysis_carterae.AAC.4